MMHKVRCHRCNHMWYTSKIGYIKCEKCGQVNYVKPKYGDVYEGVCNLSKV